MNNFNGPYAQPSDIPLPQPKGLEARFHKAPAWVRWGLISLTGLIFISTAIFLMVLVGSAFAPDQPVAAGPTALAEQQVPTPSPTPSPTATPQPIHYPPATQADLRGLAAKGDASAIHSFHNESVGLTGVCPQPKREITVDPSITGQQLAEDLLAYFYAQLLDNPCGSLVLAYHNQNEVNDPNTEGTYTAGMISLNVTDSNGGVNIDPNASNLRHKLTLDVGALGSNQEYIVTY